MFSPLMVILGLFTGVFAETIDVRVGDGGLTFDPNSFTANQGDSVSFQFYSGYGLHDVVLSSFDTPCQPAPGGFYSGIISGNQEGDPTFTINITSTSPAWFYCSVGSHCPRGMVGVINPPSGQDIAAYAMAAQDVLRQTPPGAVGGGIVATGGTDAGSAPSSTPSRASPRPSVIATGETVSSSGVVTTGDGGAASSVPVSTTGTGSGRSTPGAASTTTPPSRSPASTSPSVAATTTRTSGGRKSEWSVVLGLAVVVIGGLVGMMS